MDSRVRRHPILGDTPERKTVTITVDGRSVEACEGEPIAVALLAAGKRVLRYTEKLGEPRGIFCALGRCTDCAMTVDGRPNVRTCVTPVREGIRVETQHGRGQRRETATTGAGSQEPGARQRRRLTTETQRTTRRG